MDLVGAFTFFMIIEELLRYFFLFLSTFTKLALTFLSFSSLTYVVRGDLSGLRANRRLLRANGPGLRANRSLLRANGQGLRANRSLLRTNGQGLRANRLGRGSSRFSRFLNATFDGCLYTQGN
ncbi:hypothetical protein A374_14590 [Fictibacillus macauensis ZFHKF-1]|uniref:Uncharacterized protein n=1 Tax=Fictibacillus macauensis ZFHKF-1 TaxID=1196324 RepID=I8AGP3_9BACL|nr:hypothetical protein A374_14590 [Fictibacillus macauensis ZFHKF-1]